MDVLDRGCRLDFANLYGRPPVSDAEPVTFSRDIDALGRAACVVIPSEGRVRFARSAPGIRQPTCISITPCLFTAFCMCIDFRVNIFYHLKTFLSLRMHRSLRIVDDILTRLLNLPSHIMKRSLQSGMAAVVLTAATLQAIVPASAAVIVHDVGGTYDNPALTREPPITLRRMTQRSSLF